MKSKYIKKDEVKIKIRGDKEIALSEIHKEILTVMDEIDRICRKNNITYGLIAGSALGMVNYGGFIPWDDDIDMFVLRSDWDKFIKALDRELGEDFYYHCYEKDDRYNVLIPRMKIRKKKTYVEEVNFLLDNRCDGDGIFVDVVPYGEICENKFIDEFFRTIVKILTVPLILIDNMGFNPKLLKKIVMGIDKFYNDVSKGSSLLSQPVIIPWEKFMNEPVFNKKDVLPVKEYDFEGRKYYSYNNIEKILKEWYGSNCLKKWDKDKEQWIETLPVDRRMAKHIRDVNLDSDISINSKKKRDLNMLIKVNAYLIILFLLLLILDLKKACIVMFIILVGYFFKNISYKKK